MAFGGPNGISDNDLIALFKITTATPDEATADEGEDRMLAQSQQLQPPQGDLSLISTILGLQAAYSKAVALEMTGRSKEALVLYAEVTDFCRRFHRPAVMKAPALLLFIGLSMYRYGMLCTLFALDPRGLGETAQEPESRVIGELRSRLLYDAAISLRLYLMFSPHSFGRIRHEIALMWYIDALEGRFRRCNYQKTFDPELAVLGRGDSLCPESLAEDVFACTMILEGLQPLLPSSKAEAQGGGSAGRVCSSLARLAMHGWWEGLVKLSQSLFVRYAADASTYGRLVLALMATPGREQEAIRAGEVYISIGGREPSVLLVFCQACLCYRSKAQLVISTLAPEGVEGQEESGEECGEGDRGGSSSGGDGGGGFLATIPADMRNPLRLVLGLAYLCRAMAGETFEERESLFERSVEVLERAVVADEGDPLAHFYLAVAYLAARKVSAQCSSGTPSSRHTHPIPAPVMIAKSGRVIYCRLIIPGA